MRGYTWDAVERILLGRNYNQTTSPVDRHITVGSIAKHYDGMGGRVRKEESWVDVEEVIVYVDAVEVDWFVIVEAGVLLLDSIPLTL